MKKYIVILFTFFCFNLFSQENLDEFKSFETEKTNAYDGTFAVFKLSFFLPSVGAEIRLAERFSLDLATRLGINAGFNQNSSGNLDFYFFPQPSFLLEPKWNYNINRRNRRGKKTAKFSSNFLSIHSSFNPKVSLATASFIKVGPTWGIQRNMGKYGYFKFKSGLGYFHVFNVNQSSYLPVDLILDLQLGLMF